MKKRYKKITARSFLRLNEDISSIEELTERFVLIRASDLEPIEQIYQLIEDCRRFGTLYSNII